MTVTTVYPDAHVESNSVDGAVNAFTEADTDWTDLVNSAGDAPVFSDSAVKFNIAGWDERPASNKWRTIERSIVVFNDPAIDVGDTITSAVLSGYGNQAATAAGNPTVNIYSSAPASNTAIVAGDYDSLGSTAFADTGILGSTLSTSGFNDWVLNSAGLANINKNAVSKFGFRDATYDVPDSAPTHVGGQPDTNIRIWSADEDQSGDRRPKLAITHGLAFTPKVIMF
jgi:hypothetical protein